MKRTLIIILPILFTISQSCQTIGKKLYGIKNPKVETVESVEKYLSSIDLPSDNNLFCKDIVSYKTVMEIFGKSLPEAILFNSEGKMLTYKQNNQDCNAGLFETIPKLTKNSTLQTIGNTEINTFITHLVDRNGSKIQGLPKADYILFINWAKYIGKLNKDHVKVWEELANKNQNAKIIVYKINMDIMESWNVKP
jgi:hypothetical protein